MNNDAGLDYADDYGSVYSPQVVALDYTDVPGIDYDYVPGMISKLLSTKT